MPTLTVQEWELLSFFEVEPELQDDAPWAYNDALYTVHQGSLKFTFALAPAYCDVRIILAYGETRIYELNANFYPSSSAIAGSLARLYEQVADTAAAIRAYERTLELRPNNQQAAERLRALRAR